MSQKKIVTFHHRNHCANERERERGGGGKALLHGKGCC